MPRDVHWTARGNLVWAAVGGADPRTLVLDGFRTGTAARIAARRVGSDSRPKAHSTRSVAARSIALGFVLEARPQTGTDRLVPQVRGFDLGGVDDSEPLEPAWERTFDQPGDGPLALVCSDDGRVVVAATHDALQGQVRVEVMFGGSGTVISTFGLSGSSLGSLDVSKDGSRIAIGAGLDLYLVDFRGEVLLHESSGYASKAMDLSADGRRLALGVVGRLRLFEEIDGVWSEVWSHVREGSQVPTCLELDRDGSTAAVGWWDYVQGSDLYLELWDLDRGIPLVEYARDGVPGARQDLPEVARITADGRRAAFGTWGDDMGAAQVLLFDRALPDPVWTYGLSGSVRGLDLDPTGRRILVSHKNSHNNRFDDRGSIRLLDTGEGVLRRWRPIAGQPTVDLHVRPPRGATVSFLAFGERAPTPSRIPGVSGNLLVDRARMGVLAAAVDADGRAVHTLRGGRSTMGWGPYWMVQPAWRHPTGTAIAGESLWIRAE